ncbi:hypothetical protein V6N12_007166 [Hibiscus sabdariffa]|uniref:RNase H type-1 domain-containing protein n=1 Tax=Hibiscus sabdariffa TaxID=183260 RepID=A0ABR2F111_9ROSI
MALNKPNHNTQMCVAIWQAPPRGFYKLNTDGSRKHIDGWVEWRGIRMEHGVLDFPSSLVHALLLIPSFEGVNRFMLCLGLRFATGNGGDGLLGCRMTLFTWYSATRASSLVRHIFYLCKQDWDVSFHHVL